MSASIIPSASTGSVPSTLPMSPDRSLVGKLVGNLYFAAKILNEGHKVNMDAVRHEIRVLSSRAADQAAGGATSPSTSAAGSLSPVEWKTFVARLLLATQKLPHSVGCLPDGFKRDIASAIRQGRQRCGGCNSVAAEALKQLDKAAELYRSLSGPSYL